MLSKALEEVRDRRRGLAQDAEFWEEKLHYKPGSHVAWDTNEVHATLSSIRALALGYDELIALGAAEIAARQARRLPASSSSYWRTMTADPYAEQEAT